MALPSEMTSLRGTIPARWERALSEFTEWPCDVATAELGSRASPVSGPARSPLRLLLAAVIALVIVAGVTALTWMATDATGGLSALALLLTAIVALTAGRISGRGERERTRGESARLREQVRQAEAEYRAVTENLPLVTWLSAPGDRGSCVYISPQVKAMLGYSPAEWSAEPQLFSRLLHPDDRENVLDAHERADADGGRLRCEYRLVAREGRIVWVREETATVRDAVGQALYAQTFLVDVSERKRADD
jgi:PAS domain S-box-containing protein